MLELERYIIIYRLEKMVLLLFLFLFLDDDADADDCRGLLFSLL